MKNKKKEVIGMIHLMALPGTPNYGNSRQAIIDQALAEAKIYTQAGVDAIAVENMHDIPYLRQGVGAEITSLMAVITDRIKTATNLPCGIQILAAANQEALAVALATNCDFIRVEGFVFAHVADEGIINGCAGELLRYRKLLQADHISIFTDIKKKHSSHAITADLGLVETAKAAQFFASDGVIITGSATGEAVKLEDLQELENKLKIPIIIGSGITLENIEEYYKLADKFIVGSYFKKDGNWQNDVCQIRVEKFMKKFRQLG